ncbi:MAG: hypothetical protein QF552_12745 [Litorilituus sp.]|jgi:hypothetical protein|nr:hypothetical protein [Litorilituus sp.]
MKLIKFLFIFYSTFICLTSNATPIDTAQNWQTFETENFRVHYTPKYQQWALSSAREMEKIRTLIKEQQGRVLDEKVDAYIIDPYNAANGFAIPLSNAPYMALFATAPLSDSIIANSTGWQQLLILHEYVHLVHLGQKSRSRWRNKLASWFDIYDASQITEHRWVSEGYATLLESKLTGRGRLYNNVVEAIIQQFAREGALPTYNQLSKISNDYLSGSMAYLVGVRYLKWLEENYGEQTLDAVWTRWRAVKKRSFEQAFEGVFQDTAKHLYQRFVAEYTFNAMKNEQDFPQRRSTLWLDLKGNFSAPTISPNGEYFAIIDKSGESIRGKEVSLIVYNTANNTEKRIEFEQEVTELLNADAQDIAPTSPSVFKRKIAFTLNQINYRGISNPRWLDDDTIIYGASSIAKDNSRHQDLFLWHIPTDTIKQLTKEANIRRFDLALSTAQPFIIAERNRLGKSQLVKLSIEGQFIQAITPDSLAHVYDFPRIRPQQVDTATSFAYLQSSLNEKWLLKVSQFDTKNMIIVQEETVPLPNGYQFLSFPEWSKDGNSLFYVAGVEGKTKLFQYDFTTEKLVALTSGQHPISWPVVIAKDELLHLSINSQGPDVYHLTLNAADSLVISNTVKHGKVKSKLASKYKVDKATTTIDETLGKHKPYGVGPQKGTITLGLSDSSASSSLVELGYKSSDALQRFDWQVHISKDIFSNALSGYGANLRWQGWPVKLAAHAYQLDLKIQQQQAFTLPLTNIDEQGLQLQASYPYRNKTLTINTIGQIKASDHNRLLSKYAALGFKQSWFYDQQIWGVTQQANIHYLTGDIETGTKTTERHSYRGSNGDITFIGYFKAFHLGINYSWAERSSDAGDILSLGGFDSTLIQPKAHFNKQLAPELAFYSQTANDYKKITTFIPYGGMQAFYTRHEMSKQNIIDSYGIKGQLFNNFGFTGINNLAIDFGIAQVNPERQKSDTQAWIGLWHKW